MNRRNVSQLCADIDRGRDRMIELLVQIPGHLEQHEQALIDGIRGADVALMWLRAQAKQEPPSSVERASGHDASGDVLMLGDVPYIDFLRDTVAMYRRWEREYARCFKRWGEPFYAEQRDDARRQAEHWEEKIRRREG